MLILNAFYVVDGLIYLAWSLCLRALLRNVCLSCVFPSGKKNPLKYSEMFASVTTCSSQLSATESLEYMCARPQRELSPHTGAVDIAHIAVSVTGLSLTSIVHLYVCHHDVALSQAQYTRGMDVSTSYRASQTNPARRKNWGREDRKREWGLGKRGQLGKRGGCMVNRGIWGRGGRVLGERGRGNS